MKKLSPSRSRRLARRPHSVEPALEDRLLLTASLGFSFDVITSDLHPTFRIFGSSDGAPSTIMRYGEATLTSIEDLPGLSAIIDSPGDLTLEFGSDDVNNIEEVASLSTFDNGLTDGIANQVFTPDANDDPEMTILYKGVPVAQGELVQVALEITPQEVVTSPSGSSFRVTSALGDDTSIFDELMAASDFTGDMNFTLDSFEFDGPWAGVGDAERFVSTGEIGGLTTQPVQLTDDGVLEVLGSQEADIITVTETETDVTVNLNGQAFPFSIAAGSVREFAVTDIVVMGQDGRDTIEHAGEGTALAVLFDGGRGNDSLQGNAAGETLVGGDGRDTLTGDAGDDLLRGSKGFDRLRGDDGHDTLIGGDGNDNIGGGIGRDVASGGAGNDRIAGDKGQDNLAGGSGFDRIVGGSGPDAIDGGSGDDTLLGSAGHDFVNGKKGDDLLEGSDGDDTLFGESGNDSITGDDGQDVIVGGSGRDTMTGNRGRDLMSGGGGRDTMVGSGSDDILIGAATDADDDLVALDAIMLEWTSFKSYSDRVANLRDGSGGDAQNGSFFLNGLVGEDGGRNTMTGQGDEDYFWGLAREITDLSGSEIRDRA